MEYTKAEIFTRLVAAAPRMYKALKRVYDVDWKELAPETLALVRQVLAEVEGE